MKRTLILTFLFSIAVFQAFSQEKFTISGYVKDAENGEDIISATVYIKETKAATLTNVYGFYSLTIPKGEYTLVITTLGFKTQEFKITLDQNIKKDVSMSVNTTILNEVVVTGEKEDKNVTKNEMSVFELSSEKIEKAPQVFGEVDIIRTIQLLPGVSTVGEGATGFNVRGGNVDQNLVLLDEAPVYNTSHFFGLFSTFNNDVVKDVKLYKGGIPANYGGRLSSVLDVRQKEGNSKKFAAKGGIGLISSRLTLEAPIIKDKSSFIISGRRTYADIFFPLIPDLKDTKIFFYDLNTKVNYKLNDNNRLYLSGYFGQDKFNAGGDFEFGWGNATGTLRWNHTFNDKLFFNQSFVFSNYNYSLGVPDGTFAFEWKAGVKTWISKSDFNYYVAQDHTLHFGAQANYYIFNPGEFKSTGGSESQITNQSVAKQYALEPSIYLSHEWKVTKKLNINYGLRYTQFYKFGVDTVFSYRDDEPKQTSTITDTTTYKAGQVSNKYTSLKYGLAPRLGITYVINNRNSVKASYNRMYQYIHLISNTTAATPVDLWRPSDKFIKPSISDQIAVGYFRNFKDNMFETSVEAYYKWSQNIVDYKAGAELFLNNSIETELLSGRGRAYGLEFMVNKDKGKLTGWISYTLSWTQYRTKNSDFIEEQINNGEWFAANYDKRHDISVTANYDLFKNWSFGANFALNTGRPYNAPNGVYQLRGAKVGNFFQRNNARIPLYHRLDLAATHNFPKKNPSSRWESSLVISFYNVYSRKNIYSVYFVDDQEGGNQLTAFSFSVFGSIIPSVTYNFKF